MAQGTKQKRKMSKPRIVIIVICCVVLAVALFFIIRYFVQMYQATQLAEDTVAQYLIPLEAEDGDQEFKIDWEGLWAINPDVCGWIQIPAIPIINYPIIHYTDNDYYLRRAWTGEPLEAGCIMEDYHCSNDFTDFHTILYGHNMTVGSMAGTMFGQLKKFQDQSFYDSNDDRVIIYTPEANLYYTIFSIHVIQPNDPEVYVVGDFTRTQKYDFVDHLRDSTEVTTGVWADGDDKILTLSTCSGTGSTKRLVIHSELDKAVDPDTGELIQNFGIDETEILEEETDSSEDKTAEQPTETEDVA